MRTAYILDWIAEQSEDLFTVLDGDRRVIKIELLRGGTAAAPIIETVPLDDFRGSISRGSRSARLKFAIASALVLRAAGADA